MVRFLAIVAASLFSLAVAIPVIAGPIVRKDVADGAQSDATPTLDFAFGPNSTPATSTGQAPASTHSKAPLEMDWLS